MAAAGLPVDERWFIPGDFTLRSGVAAAGRWLALDERPTALFCSSDAMACGFISELNRYGIEVPGDVSVVGFDDIDIAAHFIPPLTTVRQPRAIIGEMAAAMLLQLMRAQAMPEDAAGIRGTGMVLPLELVVRRSTARPGSGTSAAVSGSGSAKTL
jgi:LacI family repressor for deo operon, udp, cdd, tsx, nupC, and nupG